MTAPPILDRESARVNPSAITAWRTDLQRSYGQLLARSDPTRPDDAEAIRDFEHACLGDQEWAIGYEAGRSDAMRIRDGAHPKGAGVSWFGDGWSASSTRRAAYELGVADGRT